MKKYSIAILFALILALLLWFVFGVFIPTNKQLGQSFLSNLPTLQKLVIDKTPAKIEGPTPPKGVNPEKWNKEYAYRLTGELEKFDEEECLMKGIPFIKHKDGAISVYLKEKPDPVELGHFRKGLDL